MFAYSWDFRHALRLSQSNQGVTVWRMLLLSSSGLTRFPQVTYRRFTSMMKPSSCRKFTPNSRQ